MERRPVHAPLRVYLNERRVGTLSREASGEFDFTYNEDWLGWPGWLRNLWNLA